MMQPAYYAVYGDRETRRTGARHASIAPYGPYRAGDGLAVFLGVQSDREWGIVCRDILGRPDLIDDPRFARNTERVENDAQITPLIEEALSGGTADEVVERLEAAGIACARLRTPAEFFDHPQLQARDRWRTIDTPGGPVQALLPAVTVVGSEAAMGQVPALGAHNAALRAEFAPRSAEIRP
jgi:crotonobetainyl-CoA:carnitine CoA-transferase CaiB-like acyl-CoA transferase